MNYRLLDASCILDCFDKEKDNKRALIDDISSNEYFCYIPQFCITEVFNTINKWYYRKDNSKSKITLEQATELINIFVDMLKNRKYCILMN